MRCALLPLLLLAACATAQPATRPAVTTGAQRLVDSSFAALDGLAVGLVTNHTATVDTADGGPGHLIDRLHAAPNVRLAVLFGPEHGLRGTAEAGAAVEDGSDPATGVPVFSLYGATKTPPPEALAGLDALVFDMQDVGARFYTYTATMGRAMQAAAEAGLVFVVLDRPNPLGGRADGFVREPEHASFVGLYPVPVQHGLTAGELARMIVGESWLPGLDSLGLRVVEMAGWHRAMPWPDTGLPFTPTSPNIPSFETALVYPGVALFEGTTASEGRGTETPFLVVGAPDLDAAALADTLAARRLPGLRFEAARFTPRSIPGVAARPKHEGEALHGVRLLVSDASSVRPVAVGVHLLHAVYHARSGPGFFQAAWLAKLAGTRRLQRMLEAGERPEAVVAAWQAEVEAFDLARQPYLLYD